jgi:hypothetical protein
MTRDDIILMARKAGYTGLNDPWLHTFAALVAAQEREACAKVCDNLERANLYGVKECAAAIRARGQE